MYKRLLELIKEAMPDLDVSKATEDSRLIEDLGFDSLPCPLCSTSVFSGTSRTGCSTIGPGTMTPRRKNAAGCSVTWTAATRKPPKRANTSPAAAFEVHSGTGITRKRARAWGRCTASSPSSPPRWQWPYWCICSNFSACCNGTEDTAQEYR